MFCLVGCGKLLDEDGKYKTMEGYYKKEMEGVAFEEDLFSTTVYKFDKIETVVDENNVDINLFLKEGFTTSESEYEEFAWALRRYKRHYKVSAIADDSFNEMVTSLHVYDSEGTEIFHLDMKRSTQEEDLEEQLREQGIETDY